MYAVDRRVVACRIYSFLQSLRKTAIVLQVSHSTVARWLKCPHRKQYSTRVKPKTTTQVVEVIRSSLSVDPFLTVRRLKQIVFDVVGVGVSNALVHTAIKSLGLSRKKARHFPRPTGLEEKTAAFLMRRDDAIASGRPIYSMDETSFGRTGRVIFGYSKRGQRLMRNNRTLRMTTISVLACASKDGWVEFASREGSFDTSTFLEFLRTLDLPPKSVLLLDNVAFHHSTSVKQFLESNDIEPLYTPPYSPWFNPIEMCFSIVKRKFGEYEDVMESFTALRPRHFEAFFRKSLSCIGPF